VIPLLTGWENTLHSSDLNPLDFHLKTVVYATVVDNEEALNHALCMPVRISATAPASLSQCGSP
jgi:hypothetical protein